MRKVWRRLDAKDFGVPQLRPRAILVAIREDIPEPAVNEFRWPLRIKDGETTVAEKLKKSMRERCLPHWDKNQRGESPTSGEKTGKDIYDDWLEAAEKSAAAGRGVAPTLVGGSRKHGGADLGPTRAKKAWAAMGVDAMGVANDPDACDPERDLFRENGPMLTVEQAAIIQGFPRHWRFQGKRRRDTGRSAMPSRHRSPRLWAARSPRFCDRNTGKSFSAPTTSTPQPDGMRCHTNWNSRIQLETFTLRRARTMSAILSAQAAEGSCSQKRRTSQPASLSL